MQKFFSGLWTQRSPFNGPDNRYNTRFLGGRPDMLIDGLNVELTNYGTIIRRPGMVQYSTAVLPAPGLAFYSFHDLTGAIRLMVDTVINVSVLTTTSNTNIFTKSLGSGQTDFQSVGNTLYFGDNIDLQAWNPSINLGTRNWGISIGTMTGALGPFAPATATDVNFAGVAWSNPNNIKTSDGAFSTISLVPNGTPTTQGPQNCGTGSNIAGPAANWSTPSQIAVTSGSSSVTLAVSGATQSSNFLAATNFGFSIPATATITGISAVVTRQASVANTIRDSFVALTKNGSTTIGTGFSIGTFWPTSSQQVTYGGTGNLWGAAWSAADINSSNFGLLFSAINFSGVNPGTATVSAFVTITVFYNLPTGGTIVSDFLQATNFSFTVPNTSTVTGVLVEIQGQQPANSSPSSLSVSMLKNGNIVGTPKNNIQLPSLNGFVSLGGAGDLWGTSWTPNDTDQTTFGVSIQAVNSSPLTASFSVDFVRVTVFTVGGLIVTLVAGSLTATTGYQYVIAYGNSNSGHVSNPSLPSNTVKPSTQGVQIPLIASTDPQVNQIHVYRTKDGGSVYYELPTSPYPNTTQNVTDNATDASLQQFIFWPVIPTVSNTPPPAGLIHYTYHLGRIWGTVGNFVYYSAGPDIVLGNGNEAFPPANNFLFPSTVLKLVPISSGLLVFTTDDTFIILGTNLATFYSMPFQPGLGLLGENAIDVQGSNIFLWTSDRQFVQLSSAGINEIGYAVGDLLQAQFDPATDIHVASLIAGTADKAVFIGDAVGNWYRCNWNQPPEGGPAWSPKATIAGGFTHFQAVETSPGVHQLLAFQTTGAGTIILARSQSTFSDNGQNYGAFLTLGSVVLAQPGQLAEVVSVTTELQNRGQQPDVSVLLEEISGVFEPLPTGVPDPPGLIPSNSVLATRFYLNQSQNTVDCRHLQIKLTFAPEAVKNELLTVAIFGALKYHE